MRRRSSPVESVFFKSSKELRSCIVEEGLTSAGQSLGRVLFSLCLIFLIV